MHVDKFSFYCPSQLKVHPYIVVNYIVGKNFAAVFRVSISVQNITNVFLIFTSVLHSVSRATCTVVAETSIVCPPVVRQVSRNEYVDQVKFYRQLLIHHISGYFFYFSKIFNFQIFAIFVLLSFTWNSMGAKISNPI